MEKKMNGRKRTWPVFLPGLPGIPPDAPYGAGIRRNDLNAIVIIADAQQTDRIIDLLFPLDISLTQ